MSTNMENHEVQHSNRAHAALNASSSHRWMMCPPSVRLSEQFADQTSVYAEEGTFLHELSELKLHRYLGDVVPEVIERQYAEHRDSEFYSEEAEAVTDVYVNHCIETIEAVRLSCADPYIAVEQRLDYSEYVPEGFGTGDMLIIGDGVLEILDFKGGRGVRVDADHNSQLISIRANNCRFRILSSTATTKQQFLDLMGDAVAYYELATPIPTDITELMPSINIVNTEPGGLITFEQTDTALPIPTTLVLSPWTDITNDVNMIALQARDEASAAQETAESAQSTADAARTEFQRVVRINDEGLHVGDNQSSGEVLIDSNSVNVVFNGQKYSKFAANYVQFGNYQLRRSSDGGLVFKLS